MTRHLDTLSGQLEELTALVTSTAFECQGLDAACREITEAAVRILNVGRASIWLLDCQGKCLLCTDLYDSTSGRHEHAASQLVPRRWQGEIGPAEAGIVAIDDAANDPRADDVREAYLRPIGITSLLDAAIWRDGRFAGLLVLASPGPPRCWCEEDKVLARSLAELISRHLERSERHRAERHLRDGEHGIGALLEIAPQPLLVVEEGRYVYANRRAHELFRASSGGLIGRRAADFYHDPADRTAAVEILEREGTLRDFEARLRRDDGETFWAVIAAEQTTYLAKPAVMVGLADITERKLAQDAAEIASARLRHAIDTIPEGFVICDADDRIVIFNEAYRNLHPNWQSLLRVGRDYKEMLREASLEGLIPAARRGAEEFYEQRIAQHLAADREPMVWSGDDGRHVQVTCSRSREGGTATVVTDITQIVQRESALAASEAKYRSTLDNTSEGYWLLDKDGNTLDVNPALCRMLGFEREEILGKSPLEFSRGRDRTEYAQRLNEVPKSDQRSYQVVLTNKSGDRIHTRYNATTIRDDDGAIEGSFAFVSDITEQTMAEAALRESEERFRVIAETIPVPLLITRITDGTILYVNGECASYFGTRRDDLVGLRAPNYYEPAVRAEAMRQLADTGSVRNKETSISLPDGSRRRIIANAQVMRFETESAVLTTLLDITESTRANEALKERERQYRALAELSPDGVFVQVDGRIAFVNQSACRMVGADTADDLIGQDALSIVEPGQRDFVQARREQSTASQNATPYVETRHLRLDGVAFPSEMVAAPIEWYGRMGTINIIRDITERKKAEDGLRQAQKMEALGQLTGGVAHDFNNLLAIIQGNISILDRKLADESQLKALTMPALRAVKRGSSLTHRLLAFSRRQPLAAATVDVGELVASLDDMLRRSLGEDVAVETTVAKGLWRCKADPGQFEQAIVNLANNARDAMAEGGTLRIEAANVPLSEYQAAQETDLTSGEYVMIAVTDSGHGMTAGLKEKVFEPFFTTKAVDKGTGLGLSMVYGFAKQSGGHVTVYSEPGIGSTFKLYLPRCHNNVVTSEISKGRLLGAKSGETILVVEDDTDLRTLAVVILTELGYRVLEAPTGPAALQLLQREDSVDLLVTDVVLPSGMNGRDVAAAVQSKFPSVKVLFMSGYAENAIVHQGCLDPGIRLLAKPFDPEDLAETVHQVLFA